MEIGDGDSSGSGTDGASINGSSYEDEEPLDYLMLELAPKLPAGEAAAFMERLRRQERHNAKIEQRLRKRLSTVSTSPPRVSEPVEAIVRSPKVDSYTTPQIDCRMLVSSAQELVMCSADSMISTGTQSEKGADFDLSVKQRTRQMAPPRIIPCTPAVILRTYLGRLYAAR